MVRFIDCRGPHCDGGRIVGGHPNDPSPPDYGSCPICNGTGTEEIEDEPVTLDDLCADGECQYAKDVGMWPEHRCGGKCQYEARNDANDFAALGMEMPGVTDGVN